jgi:hypothetical protein
MSQDDNMGEHRQDKKGLSRFGCWRRSWDFMWEGDAAGSVGSSLNPMQLLQCGRSIALSSTFELRTKRRSVAGISSRPLHSLKTQDGTQAER